MADAAAARIAQALSVEEFRLRLGTQVGISAWHRLSQSDINAFAAITDDLQYIHVDEFRAMDGPFSGTIAHGMHTLSMISVMFYEAVPSVQGAATSINYGFDKVRFMSPVPSGSEISGSFTLSSVEERGPGRYLFRYVVTILVQGAAKPAVYADWLVMHAMV